MRGLAWSLVVVGLLLLPGSWLYAWHEEARRYALWVQQGGLFVTDVTGRRPSIEAVSRGALAVDFGPGVYAGLGLVAFGILLLAIRRPPAHNGGRA
jgi:hypothetical protein